MVLSRFWLVIFISSILFIVVSLFSANTYTIDYVLNGKKDDPVLISEKYIEQVPAFIKDSIKKATDQTMIINRDTLNADTTYVYKNKTVKIFSGVQKSDGLLPTCKSTLVDLILPLIAYLAFFCGLMELLIISGASGKLAKLARRVIFLENFIVRPILGPNCPPIEFQPYQWSSLLSAYTSIASASSFFSFAFSSSRDLSRLASDTSSPPYLAFHL